MNKEYVLKPWARSEKYIKIVTTEELFYEDQEKIKKSIKGAYAQGLFEVEPDIGLNDVKAGLPENIANKLVEMKNIL